MYSVCSVVTFLKSDATGGFDYWQNGFQPTFVEEPSAGERVKSVRIFEVFDVKWLANWLEEAHVGL